MRQCTLYGIKMRLTCESRKWKAELITSEDTKSGHHLQCCKVSGNAIRVRKFRLGRFQIILELKSTSSEPETGDSFIYFPHLQHREPSELPSIPEPSELHTDSQIELLHIHELPDLRLITPELSVDEHLCELEGGSCLNKTLSTSNPAWNLAPFQNSEEPAQSDPKSERYSGGIKSQLEPSKLSIEKSPSLSLNMHGQWYPHTSTPVSPIASSPDGTYDLTTQSELSPVSPSTPQPSNLAPPQQNIASNYDYLHSRDAQYFPSTKVPIQTAYGNSTTHSTPSWTSDVIHGGQYEHSPSYSSFSPQGLSSHQQTMQQPIVPATYFMQPQNFWEALEPPSTAPIPQETQAMHSPSWDLVALGSHVQDYASDALANSDYPMKVDQSQGRDLYSTPAFHYDDERHFNVENSHAPGFTPEFPDLFCEQCPTSKFTGKYGKGNLARHCREKHNENKPTTGKKCRQCGQSFQRADAKRHHEWERHGLLDSKPNKRMKKN